MEGDGLALPRIYWAAGTNFTGADKLLQELTHRGYQIYAATNGVTYIQENRLLHSPIQSYFKEVFISEQMGTQSLRLIL